VLTCPRCGEQNPDHARFCLACGNPFPEPPSGSGEVRKTVTLVFTDVASSTELGERLDAESLRKVMSRYFEAMREAIEHHEGTVEKFIGDAVMAVFGVPTLHEDDALRAVRAADEMRTALGALNEELDREWGVRVETRTGVNTGEVVVGDPGSDQGLVLGDAVNVAARLEQVAGAGEILIGADTHRLVRDAVEAEAMEPLLLKGKREAVPAFRLLAVKPGAPGYTRRLDSPMVGRDGERILLWQAFERAVRDRTCHLFTILGVAGVGKSRLAGELTTASSERATILGGRCLPYGEGITYWPVVEMVRQAAGITEQDTFEAVRARIRDVLAGEADAPLVADRLAPLFGAAGGATGTEEASWAVRRFLESVAATRPVVVVFDDIHWGEPIFLDLVEYVAEWSREAPILLVCLARPELLDARSEWGGGKLNATSIHLEPLSEDEAAVLASNLLGLAELPGEARTVIARAGEGNPLYVEEMVAMLVEDGLLRREDDRWMATNDLSSVRLPPTIQALLAARLERLGPEERAVVERAAVEGKVFHRAAVEALTPARDRPEVDERLQLLVRKELIRPTQSELAGLDAFAFRHLLIRDAAYQATSKTLRADLHAVFADWLLETAGPRAREYEEIAGYHLEQAFRYRRALGALDETSTALGRRAAERLGGAGRRAFARGDVPAAANLLDRAIGLLPEGDPVRRELTFHLAVALADRGEFARASALVAEVIEAAVRDEDQRLEWRARVEQAVIRIDSEATGHVVEEARRTAARAIEVLTAMDDAAGLARAWWLKGAVGWMEARADAAEEGLERAVEYARVAGDSRAEVEGLVYLASAQSWAPLPASLGIERAREVVARSGGHPKVEGLSLVAQGQLEAMRGNTKAGRDLMTRGRTMLRELGLEVLWAATSHAAGAVEMYAGDPEAAERQWRQGYDALGRMGEKAYRSTSAAFLAHALARQGRYEEAEPLAVTSEAAADPHDIASQLQWRSVRALVEAHAGNMSEALRLADDAVLLGEPTSYVDTLAETLVIRAEIRRLAGMPGEAADDLRRAIDLAEHKEYASLLERAGRMLGELEG
jgi:class 3 adenylate cyclase/tetratricopeptide (TPR) repeat protein